MTVSTESGQKMLTNVPIELKPERKGRGRTGLQTPQSGRGVRKNLSGRPHGGDSMAVPVGGGSQPTRFDSRLTDVVAKGGMRVQRNKPGDSCPESPVDVLEATLNEFQLFGQNHRMKGPERRKYEKALADAIKAGGEGGRQARNTLVEGHLGLIPYWANRIGITYGNIESLIWIGVTALIRAAENFDPKEGYLFITYASRCLFLRMKEVVTHGPGAARTSHYGDRRAGAILRMRSEMFNHLEREPTPEEVASALFDKEHPIPAGKFTPGQKKARAKALGKRIELAAQVMAEKANVYLSQPVGSDMDAAIIEECIAGKAEDFEQVESLIDVLEATRGLTARQRTALLARILTDCTFDEITALLPKGPDGKPISVSRAQQLVRAGAEKARKTMA